MVIEQICIECLFAQFLSGGAFIICKTTLKFPSHQLGESLTCPNTCRLSLKTSTKICLKIKQKSEFVSYGLHTQLPVTR